MSANNESIDWQENEEALIKEHLGRRLVLAETIVACDEVMNLSKKLVDLEKQKTPWRQKERERHLEIHREAAKRLRTDLDVLQAHVKDLIANVLDDVGKKPVASLYQRLEELTLNGLDDRARIMHGISGLLRGQCERLMRATPKPTAWAPAEQDAKELHISLGRLHPQDMPGIIDAFYIEQVGNTHPLDEIAFMEDMFDPHVEVIAARERKNDRRRSYQNPVLGFSIVNEHKDYIDLYGLCVHPAHRRRGIGTQLIRDAKDRLYPAGPASLSTVVSEYDLPAQLFLRKHGLYHHKTYRPEGDVHEDTGYIMKTKWPPPIATPKTDGSMTR